MRVIAWLGQGWAGATRESQPAAVLSRVQEGRRPGRGQPARSPVQHLPARPAHTPAMTAAWGRCKGLEPPPARCAPPLVQPRSAARPAAAPRCGGRAGSAPLQRAGGQAGRQAVNSGKPGAAEGGPASVLHAGSPWLEGWRPPAGGRASSRENERWSGQALVSKGQERAGPATCRPSHSAELPLPGPSRRPLTMQVLPGNGGALHEQINDIGVRPAGRAGQQPCTLGRAGACMERGRQRRRVKARLTAGVGGRTSSSLALGAGAAHSA